MIFSQAPTGAPAPPEELFACFVDSSIISVARELPPPADSLHRSTLAASGSRMGKDKAEKAEAGEEVAYDTKVKFCSVIANPLADEKLSKKVLKLCKKASKRKQIRRGVKEVVKALRKKQKG